MGKSHPLFVQNSPVDPRGRVLIILNTLHLAFTMVSVSDLLLQLLILPN